MHQVLEPDLSSSAGGSVEGRLCASRATGEWDVRWVTGIKPGKGMWIGGPGNMNGMQSVVPGIVAPIPHSHYRWPGLIPEYQWKTDRASPEQ